MSKTVRKRAESYVAYWGHYYTVWDRKNKRHRKAEHYYTWRPYEEEWESYRVDEAKYNTDNYGQGYFRKNKPKHYRNMINRSRRRRDKRELWKELNFEGYDGLYSSWNCKDADPTWYW